MGSSTDKEIHTLSQPPLIDPQLLLVSGRSNHTDTRDTSPILKPNPVSPFPTSCAVGLTDDDQTPQSDTQAEKTAYVSSRTIADVANSFSCYADSIPNNDMQSSAADNTSETTTVYWCTIPDCNRAEEYQGPKRPFDKIGNRNNHMLREHKIDLRRWRRQSKEHPRETKGLWYCTVVGCPSNENYNGPLRKKSFTTKIARNRHMRQQHKQEVQTGRHQVEDATHDARERAHEIPLLPAPTASQSWLGKTVAMQLDSEQGERYLFPNPSPQHGEKLLSVLCFTKAHSP